MHRRVGLEKKNAEVVGQDLLSARNGSGTSQAQKEGRIAAFYECGCLFDRPV